MPPPGPSAGPALPAAAPPPAQSKTRDELDEFLGVQTAPKPAPAPPIATAPAAAPPRPAAAPAPAARPPASKPQPEGADPGGSDVEKSADKILEEAQAAYVGGERQRAIEMALQVTRRPNANDATRAWRFIGSAACSVRSATLATRAYNNLPSAEHRQLLTELCKRNGLNFNDGQFIAE